VRDRCEIVGGDFFSDPIPQADVLILSQVLHDWNDDHASVILDNCRRGLTEGGRLLLVEGVVADGAEGSLRLLDLHMLVLLGGRERTENEWQALLARSKFKLVKVLPRGLIEAEAT
jgi:SAM-dependent methyltransferase